MSTGVVSLAAAHFGHRSIQARRYFKVEVAPGHARLVISLTVGGEEALRVLRAADDDGDGRVAPEEASQYVERWGKKLGPQLPIVVDGHRVEATWTNGYMNPLGRVHARPTTVEMTTRVSLPGGRHRITLRDEMQGDAFERTDVKFRTRGAARLVASGTGVSPQDKTHELAFGPTADVAAITAVVELPNKGSVRVYWVAAAGTAVVLGSALAWLVRRRRR